MISIEQRSKTAIDQLPPDIASKLRRVGDFYLCTHFTNDEIGPPIAKIGEAIYYRFMDFIYLPQPPESLTTEQIIAICDLRLAHMDQLVVAELNERVVAKAVACAKEGSVPLHPPIQALDFGCGSGLSSTLLQKHWPELSLIGVDISAKAVACSLEQHQEAYLIQSDQPLPFKDASFDVIFAIFVMHFNLEVATLVELKRILRPAGKFVFNVYQRDIDGVVAQLQDAGFDSIQVQEIGGAGKIHSMVSCSPLSSHSLTEESATGR